MDETLSKITSITEREGKSGVVHKVYEVKNIVILPYEEVGLNLLNAFGKAVDLDTSVVLVDQNVKIVPIPVGESGNYVILVTTSDTLEKLNELKIYR